MEIIEESNDFLVINKPTGIAVHPGIKTGKTLIEEILEKYPEIKEVGEKNRPGVVHRLDQNVSGVLVIARNQEFYEHLKKLFHERKIKKEYIGLVYGRIAKPEGEIKFPLARSKKNWLKIATQQKGKEAKTYFEVLKRFQQYTLLKIMPETGRTHQIRAHLLAYGHPLVGDPVYKIKKIKPRKDIERIFLHAAKISFNGFSFSAPLPADCQNFLNKLY